MTLRERMRTRSEARSEDPNENIHAVNEDGMSSFNLGLKFLPPRLMKLTVETSWRFARKHRMAHECIFRVIIQNGEKISEGRPWKRQSAFARAPDDSDLSTTSAINFLLYIFVGSQQSLLWKRY